MTIKPLYAILLTINNIQMRFIALAVAKEMIINLYMSYYISSRIIKLWETYFQWKEKKRMENTRIQIKKYIYIYKSINITPTLSVITFSFAW